MFKQSTFIVSAVACVFSCSIIFAEPPADDLLAGPTIEKEDVSENDLLSRRLSETGKKNKINSKQQIRMWMSTLELINLTIDQKIKVHAIVKELRNKQNDFQKKHGEEIASLRKEQNNAKKSDSELSSDSKTRMLELMKLAPDVTEYQDRAWVLLSVDQQNDFKKHYQLKIDEEMKRKEERKLKDLPMSDEPTNRGFSPEDSLLRDKKVNPKDDFIERHDDSVDKDSMRRIKFLRRLQELKED
ncbi:MAG: hypothetical protein QF718_06475 [Phycisphaerales bacterium]|nr:hypothetical protein [Phycisphaerales bacterium]